MRQSCAGISLILIILILSSTGYAKIAECKFSKNFLLKKSKTKTSIYHNKFKITFEDNWSGKDKADHCMVSLFLVVGSYYFLNQEQKFDHNKSIYISTGFALSLGLLKEVHDGFIKKNAASFKDIIADILGISLGNILFNID